MRSLEDIQGGILLLEIRIALINVKDVQGDINRCYSPEKNNLDE
jgi:hypothetical protein